MTRLAIGDGEKKNLMILGGLLGLLAIVVLVLYNPFSGGGSGEEEPAPPTPAAGAPVPDPAAGAGGVAAAGATPAAAPAGSISAASLASLGDYRVDPFERFALPMPTPPPPPVEIPPPVDILPPSAVGPGGIGLPPMSVGNSRSNILVDLPPISPRRVVTAPTAPRSFVLPGTQGTGGGSVLRSQNKRLSGVVIGDSVRALLEVTVGDKVTTRVVQPGDEVDGITILRLERVVEAGQTVTRLVVRENNQEQYVELRPAPQQQQQGGIDGLMPGGMPGGMPPM